MLFKSAPVVRLINWPISPPAFPANISGWVACKANCWVKKPIPLCDKKNLDSLATSLADLLTAVEIPPLINPSEKLSIKPKKREAPLSKSGISWFFPIKGSLLKPCLGLS